MYINTWITDGVNFDMSFGPYCPQYIFHAVYERVTEIYWIFLDVWGSDPKFGVGCSILGAVMVAYTELRRYTAEKGNFSFLTHNS